MATFVTGVAKYFIEQGEGTTDPTGTDPSGENRAVIGGVAAIHSGAQTISASRYDGASGTDLDKIGADEAFNFSNAAVALYGGAPGPDAETEAWGDWVGTPLMAYVVQAYYSGLDQVTPYEGRFLGVGNDGGPVSDLVASAVAEDCPAGKTISALVAYSSGSASASGFSEVEDSGTTLLPNCSTHFFTGGLALIQKESGAGGDITLSVNVHQSSASSMTWRVIGVVLNDAAGGGSPQTATLGGTAEREAAGGAVAAPGAATVAAGGSRAAELTGGVATQPGAVTVQPGGTAAAERAGALSVASGVATVLAGGTSEREAAGGVIAAAGVQTIAAGGTASVERGGGLIVVPGVATVVAGGVAEQSLSGGHQVAPGVVGIALGGSAQSELIGGLSAQIGVASLDVGGLDEQERPGGASVYGGAVQLQLGGVAETQRAGGLLMVDGTAPVPPTWPGGGTARIGGRQMADVDDRIGNRRATVQKQRIG